MLRFFGPVFGALLSVLAASQISLDPPPMPRSQQLADRKGDDCDDDADAAEAAAAETLGTLFNVHSGEAVVLSSDEPSMDRFSGLLEDRVSASRARMEPRLLGLLRVLASGRAPARIELVSGYRSPKLNEMLRKKGRRVASHSQHSLALAMDFRIIGLTPEALRDDIERSGWQGGIGIYPGVTDRFVHADAGPDRRWVGH